MITKKGFTLAEVLVSMAIVGIVAALVMPALYNNSKKSAMGASLASSVELLQNGMKNIFTETTSRSDSGSIETLSAIRKSDIGLDGDTYITDDNAFYDLTRGLLGIEDSDYGINNIKTYNNAAPSETLTEGLTAYKFKKSPAVVLFHNVSIANIATAADDDIIAKVIIDANGAEQPNKFGEDVFLFGLTNRGILIPAGSEKYHDFDNTVATGACSTGSVGDGTACAARVMADKWEIKY